MPAATTRLMRCNELLAACVCVPHAPAPRRLGVVPNREGLLAAEPLRGFDAGRPDHAAVPVRFRDDKLAELRRRARHDLCPQLPNRALTT